MYGYLVNLSFHFTLFYFISFFQAIFVMGFKKHKIKINLGVAILSTEKS